MSLSVEERAFFESRGLWREINPPSDVDSLGKLNEWLAECGMPQRDCLKDEIGILACTEAEQWMLGVEFPVADRDNANSAHRGLIKYVAGAFYGRLSYMAGQKLVWRVRPEVTEDGVYKYFAPDGTEIDPDTYSGPEFQQVDTGNRVAKFYARFWLESETSK